MASPASNTPKELRDARDAIEEVRRAVTELYTGNSEGGDFASAYRDLDFIRIFVDDQAERLAIEEQERVDFEASQAALLKQLRLAEDALRAIVRNADCYGHDQRSSDYVRGLQEAADVARRYEAAADGVFV